MSEQMQPIDPVTAAMLMGQVPDPCEPIIEISRKVLTKLLDVVEFGDQLERVEKDRLLAHLKDVLAEEQPELWAIHIPGPGEVHPMISKEAAEQEVSELIALFNEHCPTVPITVNVIPSPFSPLEHFELLAEETIQHREDLLVYVKELEEKAVAPSKSCTWKLDDDTGAYNTGCGQTWSFTDGGEPEEHGALFCHHCAGLIVVERRQLFAYQVGDNDIVAAYDPAGAIKVLVEFSGLGDLDDYDESDVDLVSDKVLDATEAYDIDEGKTVTLEKTLRQELYDLTEPAYLHGWE